MSAKAIKEIIDAGADKVVEFMNKGRDNAADIVVAAYADPEQGVRFYDDSTIGSKTTKLIYENYYNLNETAQDFVKHSELFEGEAIEDLQDLKTPEEKDEFFRTASNVIDTHYYCSGSEQNIWDYFVYWPNRAKLRVVLNIQSTLNSVLKLAAYKNIFNKEPARDRARKFLLWAIRENKADQNMLDSIKVYDLFPEILALKELQTNEEKIEFFKDPDNLAATREFCLTNDTTMRDYMPFWPKEAIINEFNNNPYVASELVTMAFCCRDEKDRARAAIVVPILEEILSNPNSSDDAIMFIVESCIFSDEKVESLRPQTIKVN